MGSGYRSFAASEVLTSGNVQGYLMKQSVMYFATTTARDTALSGSLERGMTCYIGSNDASEGLYTYNGTSWRKGPGWNAPWGRVASQTSNTTQTTTGGTEATIKVGPAFTAVANRYYRINLSGTFYATDSGAVYDLRIRDGSLTGTELYRSRHGVTAGAQTTVNLCVTVTLSAGSHTPYYTVQLASGAGTGGSLSGLAMYWTIDDMGPSGAPA